MITKINSYKPTSFNTKNQVKEKNFIPTFKSVPDIYTTQKPFYNALRCIIDEVENLTSNASGVRAPFSTRQVTHLKNLCLELVRPEELKYGNPKIQVLCSYTHPNGNGTFIEGAITIAIGTVGEVKKVLEDPKIKDTVIAKLNLIGKIGTSEEVSSAIMTAKQSTPNKPGIIDRFFNYLLNRFKPSTKKPGTPIVSMNE